MRILLLVHGFNSLSQRIFVALSEQGHDVSVEFDINNATLEETVKNFNPNLILAPFLKRAIPEQIWKHVPCLIVHPGIAGDRGPSSLDWAILNSEAVWGVTVLQAEAEMDAGPIWATHEFNMRTAKKSSLYKNEVANAALIAVNTAIERFSRGTYTPKRLSDTDTELKGQLRPLAKQTDRQIDWPLDNTATVIRKINSADGMPGVKDNLFGQDLYLFDAQPADNHHGNPGEILAVSGPAICRATIDGAVWIGHITNKNSDHPFKLPATVALAEHLDNLPQTPIDLAAGFKEITYQEQGDVGYLRFNFYNGAMGTEQCKRLHSAYLKACSRPTKVIVMLGGEDFWSNGIHLNLIEAASSPADESWANINAMDDLAEAIIRTESHLTIAALQGNAGAGGVFLARACDFVWMRNDIVLNPHYKDMGNLYGSEFWTYLLPRYAGEDNAKLITSTRLPMGTKEAVKLGLGDARFGHSQGTFLTEVKSRAQTLATATNYDDHLLKKQATRHHDEAEKPLAEYRSAELQKMRTNFYGFDPSYHVARYNFVYKIPKSRTPLTIARHRTQNARKAQKVLT